MPAHRKPTQLQTILIGTDRADILRSFCQATELLRRTDLRDGIPSTRSVPAPVSRREP